MNIIRDIIDLTCTTNNLALQDIYSYLFNNRVEKNMMKGLQLGGKQSTL